MERSAIHEAFSIERTYDASASRVFAAFASAEAKKMWFGSSDDATPAKLALDFRIGGRETTSGGPPGGPLYTYEATYQDIVLSERIVSTYVMHMDGALISVSLATVVLRPDGNRTHLTYTEQGVYLDGLDQASIREHGTGELLGALGAYLKGSPATATA